MRLKSFLGFVAGVVSALSIAQGAQAQGAAPRVSPVPKLRPQVRRVAMRESPVPQLRPHDLRVTGLLYSPVPRLRPESAVYHPDRRGMPVPPPRPRNLATRHYRHVFGYVWCVGYARDVSHIHIHGDAYRWWQKAAGRYARGHKPEAGAILSFRSTHRIPLGHIAVVSKVVNRREVLIDQANWIPDTVTHDTPVIDVSKHNDWSVVRVLNRYGHFGSRYPTHGFIYDRAPGAQPEKRKAQVVRVAFNSLSLH